MIDAPQYIKNEDIRKDLKIAAVYEKIRNFAKFSLYMKNNTKNKLQYIPMN